MLGDAACVVDIIKTAAAAGLGCIGNSMLARETRLIPELQREADNLGAFIVS